MPNEMKVPRNKYAITKFTKIKVFPTQVNLIMLYRYR